jgi:hypothetical protein
MDQIKIFDAFLNDEELEKCIKYINEPKWEFGHISLPHTTKFQTFFWVMSLIDISFFSLYLKDKIQTITGKIFTVDKVYANGQTYGQNGTFHTDSDNKNCYTFCLYITNNPNEFSGDLEFKLRDLPHIIKVETKYNRGIFFPSNFLHKGNALLSLNDLRICIAWKLKLVQFLHICN